ncbi:MauE/DoxX family redox-associated membrane protein [Streptomyces cellulosae]
MAAPTPVIGKKTWGTMQAVEAFGRICLATVFLWSGVLKIRDFQGFRQHMARTVPFTRHLTTLLATSVPVLELSTALLLVSRRPNWGGPAFALLLLCAFTAYLSKLLKSRPGVPCGCAGTDRTPVSRTHILRNTLLIMIGAGTWWATTRWSSPSPTDYALVAAPAAVMGAMLLHLAELTSLFRTHAVK